MTKLKGRKSGIIAEQRGYRPLMAEMVGSAVVQEAVRRVSSFVFGKREDKASKRYSIERLQMALSELEFALERSAKVPITDMSLLRRKKVFRHAYAEGLNLANKHRQQELQEGQEMGCVSRARNPSISSLFGLNKGKPSCLSCSQVRRIEWSADCARKFVRDMESGYSLRHYTFCNPLIRYLLEGKTLSYELVQGIQLRHHCHIWPIILEERGVEAELSYVYDDRKTPYNSFQLRLMLRLSESTDIVGTAIECLQSLASQPVTKSAIGELTLLHGSQGISHKHTPPRVGIQEAHTQDTEFFRPDPVCCKSNGQEPCAPNSINHLVRVVTRIPRASNFHRISMLCYSTGVEIMS
ncbi:hypothetical protein BS78_02G020700 [Paspalum vaginatum]|nr:hypothetical protein BS78_02G020700 [Paspalum vaginatum]